MTLVLERLEVWTQTSITGLGTCQAVVPLLSCRTTEEVLSNAMVSRMIDITVSSGWDQRAELVLRRVLRLMYTDGTFDEFRISEIQDSSGGDGVIRVAGLGIEYDLAEQATFVSRTVNGFVSFAFTAVDTPANLFSTYVLGFAPAWIGGGTGGIIPTAVVSVDFSDDTPLSAALKIAAACNALVAAGAGPGVAFDFWLSHVGVALYGVNLGYLSQSVLPDIRGGTNLVTNRRALRTQDQTTRVYVTTGENQLGDNQWAVAAVVVNTSIDVDDINGGLSLLLAAGALDGFYVIDASNGAHLITGSSIVSSTRARLNIATTAPLAVGHWVRIAADSAGTQISHLDDLTAQATYGVKIGKLAAKVDGYTNWLKNPDFASTTTSWTVGGAPVATTTAGLWLRGGRSYKMRASTNDSLTQARSIYAVAGEVWTYSVWVYLDALGAAGPNTAFIRFDNPQTGANDFFYLDGTSVSQVGSFVRFDRSYAITTTGAKTFTAVVGNNAANGASNVYFDSAMIARTVSALDFRVGSGASRNWNQGLQHLRANANPIATYDLTTLDLYRLDPATWADLAITLGAYAVMSDADLGITPLSVRAVRLEVNHLSPTDTKVTLSTAQQQLTRILAAA